MVEPSCGDLFLDPDAMVKSEPVCMETTASVPIPPRRGIDFRDLGIELDASSQPYDAAAAMWGLGDAFRMDDDDIFQLFGAIFAITAEPLEMKMIHGWTIIQCEVDKADLIQGPTLAELNANDENLLEDLNFDDLLLPDESRYGIPQPQPPLPELRLPVQGVASSLDAAVFASGSMSPRDFNTGYGTLASSLPPTPVFASSAPAPGSFRTTASITCPGRPSSSQARHSTLHELLLKKEHTWGPLALGRSAPGVDPPAAAGSRRSGGGSSRLSSSAPTHLGLEQLWQRREPRQHLLSTGSLAEAGSTSSLSTGGVLSPESHDYSHDEGFDSEDDSDHYEDFSSDGDSSDGEGGGGGARSSMSKKERYFWQYNVQAKGPKGQRLVLKTRLADPHVLNEVTDPVFSPQCSVRGIKHSGKARKGDGNDLTPNPRKLCAIGRELDKLSRVINDMTPVSELPFNVRPKTRKEKNKLASRACRLKKKAQHEANKLKLYGLEHEHRRLNSGILQIKQLLAAKFTTETLETQGELTRQIDKISKAVTKVKIAGFTTDFVNKVLDKAKTGGQGGALEEA